MATATATYVANPPGAGVTATATYTANPPTTVVFVGVGGVLVPCRVYIGVGGVLKEVLT